MVFIYSFNIFTKYLKENTPESSRLVGWCWQTLEDVNTPHQELVGLDHRSVSQDFINTC